MEVHWFPCHGEAEEAIPRIRERIYDALSGTTDGPFKATLHGKNS